MPIYTDDHHDRCIPPFGIPLFSSIGIGPKVTKMIDSATKEWLDDHPDATTTVEDESLGERKLKPSLNLELCRCFDTTTDMQAATDLKAGMTCHTNGFHSVGDGGAAFYKVTEDGEPNGMDVLALQNELFSTLFVTEPYVISKQFGSWGDNDHDDSDYLQRSIDYAFENNLVLHIDAGIYLTSKPIYVWAGCKYHHDWNMKIVGSGYNNTFIKKINNSVGDVNNHTVDAIVCIANKHYKDDKNYSDNIETASNSACYCVDIESITLRGISDNIENLDNTYGIYSIGWFFCNFVDIYIRNCNTGFYTQTWNCYTNYKKINIDFAVVGFSFANTHIGGQTTMHFDDCHTNGISGYSYNIIGKAVLTNCSNDGGSAIVACANHYFRQTGPVSGVLTLNQCHFESQTSVNIAYANGGIVNLIDCTIEIPRTDTPAFRASLLGKCNINNCRFSVRSDANVNINPMYDTDNGGSVSFDKCYMNPYWFSGNKIPIGNYNKVLYMSGKHCQELIVGHNNANSTHTIDSDHIECVNESGLSSLTFIGLGKVDFSKVNVVYVFAEGSVTGGEIKIITGDQMIEETGQVTDDAKTYDIGWSINAGNIALRSPVLRRRTFLYKAVITDEKFNDRYIMLRVAGSSYNVNVYAVVCE